ncbi:hypothetical protein Pint_26853 [Pistacia integerrima]|uniref:Uncharacterized protein n=1 Tax=Pistacia integerrima TaxID=434235 RepID=A0ACC0YRV9_9ROSI|nr:hypothetical protein Pint_26853 [Pistacia integerrima]
MVDLVNNFPTAPIEEKPAFPVCRSHSSLDSKKPEAFSHVRAPSLAADLCPQLCCLSELGMDLEQIKVATRRYPNFAYCRLDFNKFVGGIFECRPQRVMILHIIGKAITHFPRTVNCSVEDNLRPTAEYLKRLGVNVAIILPRFTASLRHGIEVTEFKIILRDKKTKNSKIKA